MSAHAFFHRGTAILAVAIRTDRDPAVVAAEYGVDVSGLDMRGSVQVAAAPSSPEAATAAAKADAETRAIARLPCPNDAWTMSDRRWLDRERARVSREARESVAPFQGPEAEWLRDFR